MSLLTSSPAKRPHSGIAPVAAAILAAVSPGFQPGGLMWKRVYVVGSFCGPGGRDAAGYGRQDACRYKTNKTFCLRAFVVNSPSWKRLLN
jgi:hypothetical protein